MTISSWPIAVHVEVLAPSFLCTQSGSQTEITPALTEPSIFQDKQTLLPELLPVHHAPNSGDYLLDFLQIVSKFSCTHGLFMVSYTICGLGTAE